MCRELEARLELAGRNVSYYAKRAVDAEVLAAKLLERAERAEAALAAWEATRCGP